MKDWVGAMCCRFWAVNANGQVKQVACLITLRNLIYALFANLVARVAWMSFDGQRCLVIILITLITLLTLITLITLKLQFKTLDQCKAYSYK
jgi:hypothetical protein